MSDVLRTHQPVRGINLLGMMNSGKSTVGKLVAEKCGVRFVDTDDLIVKTVGRTPGDIIQADGVDAFMACQREVILGTAREKIEVWATGGAVVRDEVVVAHLRKFGNSILLQVSVPVLQSRITDEEFARIVNPNQLTLAQIYDERMPMYEAAMDARIKIDGLATTPDDVARLVIDTCVLLG